MAHKPRIIRESGTVDELKLVIFEIPTKKCLVCKLPYVLKVSKLRGSWGALEVCDYCLNHRIMSAGDVSGFHAEWDAAVPYDEGQSIMVWDDTNPSLNFIVQSTAVTYAPGDIQT